MLRGPDVAVIGYIPYYDQLADLPVPHNYGEKQLAMRLLFNSGNPPPYEVFRDYGHFRQYLEGTKEFRGAIALRNVFLEYGDDGSTPRITHLPPYLKPGYTPMRAVVKGADLAPLPLYLPGDGGASGQQKPLPGNTGAEITLRVNFKLSFLFDLFCRATYGYWAPTAWTELVYRFYLDGRIQVFVSGSAIPSQWLYVNWRIHQRHDMMLSTVDQAHGFLKHEPGCTAAPGDYQPLQYTDKV